MEVSQADMQSDEEETGTIKRCINSSRLGQQYIMYVAVTGRKRTNFYDSQLMNAIMLGPKF